MSTAVKPVASTSSPSPTMTPPSVDVVAGTRPPPPLNIKSTGIHFERSLGNMPTIPSSLHT